MFDEKELNTLDLSVKQDNLYLEESFSDLDMGSIRRLTPVKPNGLKDKSRKQIFVGHLNVMTPQGPIPIQAPIDARNLKEAMEMYPGAIKIALKKMKEQVEKLRQWWKDWNNTAREEEEFASLGQQIEKFILQED